MKNKILQEFLNSDLIIKDIQKLTYYIDFCITNDLNSKQKFLTNHHHILPKTDKLHFVQFSNLKEHSWNGSFLSLENHHKAHELLFESISHISISQSWSLMNKYNPDKDGKLYAKLLEEHNKLKSQDMMGKLAKTICIYNTKNELVFESKNIAFKDFCNLNNLPFTALKKSYQTEGSLIPNYKLLFNNGHEQYIGWYALIENTEQKLKEIQPKQSRKLKETLYIFNSDNKLVFEVSTKFVEFCGDNGLDYGKFIKSYKSGKRIKSTKFYDFDGWYVQNNTDMVPEENKPKYEIFNAEGNSKHKIYYNLKEYCAENNLPEKAFRKSYKNSSKLYQTKMSKAKVKYSSNEKYIGWYCL